MSARPSHREWLVRIGWLVLLWCGGVATVAGTGALIRWAMTAAGMTLVH